jgi:glycosyltransferase involved in cell wall biosynthesis
MSKEQRKKPKLSVLFSTDNFIKPFKQTFRDNFELSWNKIPYTPPPTSLLDYVFFPYKLLLKKIKTLISLTKCDIVFVEFADETLALSSKWKGQKKLVTRLHRYELFKLPKANWNSVDMVVVVNDWMAKNLEEKLPQMRGKIVTIHNFIDFDYWRPRENRTKSNQISIVGNIEPRKGHDKAIVAFSKILREKSELTLNIIGRSKDVRYSKELEQIVKDLKIQNKVKFRGFSTDLRRDLQETDIILSFSQHESTHLTLFEGLSCGAWPLSINWQGIEEFLPLENIFSNNSEFLEKVRFFYALDGNERTKSVKRLSKKTLVKFSEPNPREQLSNLLLDVFYK